MLTTYHLLWTMRVETPLELDDSPGTALRGALFTAIWRRFCTNKQAPTCLECPLLQVCPVSALLAPADDPQAPTLQRLNGQPWGRDIPRPYVLEPPLEGGRRYEPGERLVFGMTLIGRRVELLPYVMLSSQELERQGLGRPLPENGSPPRRGGLRIERIEAYHPFSGERQQLYRAGAQQVRTPTLAVQAEDVRQRALTLPEQRVTLTFLTPLRLVRHGALCKEPDFATLVQRLLERLEQLGLAYGAAEEARALAEQREHLLALAAAVRCEGHTMRWQDMPSYSRRLRRATPIGGLVGQATFVGDLAELRELLVWGELIHVGKNVVKGDGWYRASSAAEGDSFSAAYFSRL
ncbi:MAG: CRISPR system precrRNA processing endoribonuclease RAMP protein Cas6 [Thermogemmatispora sp.]|uniref:CRISPR system precrRNA processing endoribonuclease RAMP protein Cas6 n=2 Tax=Thermogemmatispora sp. TaxID=1968838 RepID=UPI001DC33691|nr:CRISPR system precrRNA processing endoribonuclease RAMP protein Cas6 [Thermogemmatispora sp.]MBX5450609.1 CRISPR system precrRNA processing endoribonuclease RAMP protein Cas6 [Thermogemmatispora sp.]